MPVVKHPRCRFIPLPSLAQMLIGMILRQLSAGFLYSSSKSDADMTIGLDQFVAMHSDANLERQIWMKDALTAFFLSATTIAAPYLVYLNLQSSNMNRTFMLFETKFGSMLVQTSATIVSCEENEDVRRGIFYGWYE